MLEIKFDDATRERAYTSYSQGGGTATNLYADFYAAEVNRQLREYVAKFGGISDEKLGDELRKEYEAPCDCNRWANVAKRARELLAFCDATKNTPESETMAWVDVGRNYWKARAEKAEARLENLRRVAAEYLDCKATTSFYQGFNSGVEAAITWAGFVVQPEIPAQPLRVVETEK